MSVWSMTRDERETFLAGVHVGVISVADGDGPPLTVPIWYSYEPGGLITVITGGDSRKAKLIEKTRTFSLCAQSESGMYRYVSVEGDVESIETNVDEAERKAMAYRYLGKELAEAYLVGTSVRAPDDVVIRMRPKRWWSVDYAKEFGEP